MPRTAEGIERFTLDNGLRVLVRPMRDISHAALVFMLPSGSRYETYETSGLAHFCEHLVCCGGKKYRSNTAIARTLEGVGGGFNMYTDPEPQFAVIPVPSSELRLACDVLSDTIGRPQFLAGVVERERNAILQELAEWSDDASGLSLSCCKLLLYGDHSWMWNPLGLESNIQRFGRDDLVGYHRAHYVAEDAVLSIVGGVDPREAVKIADRFFSRLPSRSTPKPSMASFEPHSTNNRIMWVDIDRWQAHVTLGVYAPPDHSVLEPTCEILAAALGGGASSRLFRKMRGVVYSVGAEYATQHDHGFLYCGAAVDPGEIPKAVELMVRTCRSFVENPISDEECERARRYVQGHRAQSETTFGAAAFLAMEELFYGEATTFNEYIHECDHVTAHDVTSLAEELFRPGRYFLGLAGPIEDSITQEIYERVPEVHA